MGWLDILGPIAGTVGALATLIFRLRSGSPKPLKSPRSRLKEDLDILKTLQETDPGHPKYDMVRNNVGTLIDMIYGEPLLKKKGWTALIPRQKVLFVMGLIAVVGFSFWSWNIVRDAFSWWVIGTGFGILMGITWIAASYEDTTTSTVVKEPPAEKPDAVPGERS